ncbi:MAG: cytochrome c [Cyclobacteriaceae bacterium]|nr:cytochrome c [Cyclobacteriaceae bacterium]
MKTNLKSILAFSTIGLFTIGLVAFTSPQTADDWEVPAKYKTMKNPHAGEDTDGIGEDLYKQHCRSCHGNEGYGDGSKAGELETEMRDLSSNEVQAQTDGELYYKSIIGRDEMPNFEKKIRSEEDRWMVINYMRSLKE